jgi:hypothetical protein
MSATGPNSEVESHSRRVRSAPMNGHRQTGPTGPFRAIQGLVIEGPQVFFRECIDKPLEQFSGIITDSNAEFSICKI